MNLVSIFFHMRFLNILLEMSNAIRYQKSKYNRKQIDNVVRHTIKMNTWEIRFDTHSLGISK